MRWSRGGGDPAEWPIDPSKSSSKAVRGGEVQSFSSKPQGTIENAYPSHANVQRSWMQKSFDPCCDVSGWTQFFFLTLRQQTLTHIEGESLKSLVLKKRVLPRLRKKKKTEKKNAYKDRIIEKFSPFAPQNFWKISSVEYPRVVSTPYINEITTKNFFCLILNLYL